MITMHSPTLLGNQYSLNTKKKKKIKHQYPQDESVLVIPQLHQNNELLNSQILFLLYLNEVIIQKFI